MRTRANGFGTRNRSHDWSRHARSAAAWSGTTTAPPFCAASNAPPLNFRRGPRGPSGVKATAEPAWSALTAPTRARTPPRVLEPSAARYPIRRGGGRREWGGGSSGREGREPALLGDRLDPPAPRQQRQRRGAQERSDARGDRRVHARSSAAIAATRLAAPPPPSRSRTSRRPLGRAH